MKVKYIRWKDQLRSIALESNTCYLEDRNWDDFGYKTTYYLYYCNQNKNIIEIGVVKILHLEQFNTSIELKLVSKLDSNFISLGQEREYYENLSELTYDERSRILNTLNDYSICRNKSQFVDLEGFNNSLLREWIASYLMDNAKEIMEQKRSEINQKNYTYITTLKEAAAPHIINFNFTKLDSLPYRNFVLVGKNGVGKTKVLEKLINSIINKDKSSFLNEEIPEYKNIILLYYGCQTEYQELKNQDILKKINVKFDDINFDECLKLIEEKKRKNYLQRLLLEIVEKEKIEDFILSKGGLSSGQEVIFKMLLIILSNISEESLIIIDEPETHLHPNIIGRLMMYMRGIIEDFVSHSIMSTHSPIVLQQTLSRSVRVIKRDKNIPIVQELDDECFGDNLSNITNNIFELSELDDEYKVIFNNLKKKNKSYEEIINLFENGLSLNARLYLANLYKNSGDFND